MAMVNAVKVSGRPEKCAKKQGPLAAAGSKSRKRHSFNIIMDYGIN